MRNGFTLVELSIVLVIIGLLVGGILVAQSLIESAQLNSFVRQLQQYDAGVASFRSKYKNLPGDSRLAFNTASTGRAGETSLRDNLLTDENTENNSLRYSATEAAEYLLFWLDLARLSSFTPENCSQLQTRTDPFLGGAGMRTSGNDCNVAELTYGEIDAAIMVAAYDTDFSENFIAQENTDGNAYFTANCELTGTSPPFFSCEPSLTQIQALAFDAKTDDGIPNTGEVLSYTDTSYGRLRANNKTYPASYDTNSNALVSLISKFQSD